MAGLYVVWTKGFSRKREVLTIAAATGRHRREVAALLMEFWEWADDETEDGTLPGIDVRILSAIHADTDDAFWSACIDAGWLHATSQGLTIPHFTRWMGYSAKRRLRDNQRKRESRVSCPVSERTKSGRASEISRTKTGPEKRREENKGNTPLPPLTLPANLDTPTFRAEWERWLAYRREIRKPLRRGSQETLLAKLGVYGPEVSALAIAESIANGWQGLFPEKVRPEGGARASTPSGKPTLDELVRKAMEGTP